MYDFDEIMTTGREVADAIKAEMERQNSNIGLIPSENWWSKAVLAAMGSPIPARMRRWQYFSPSLSRAIHLWA